VHGRKDDDMIERWM